MRQMTLIFADKIRVNFQKSALSAFYFNIERSMCKF